MMMRKFVSPLVAVLAIAGIFNPNEVIADTWNEQTHKAHPGDFNADGLSDLFLQPKISGQPAQIVLGLGDTNYTTPIQEWGSSELGANWLEANTAILVGDFDGDGRDELLLQPKSGGSLQIFEPELDGTLLAAKHSWPTSYAGVNWSYSASNLLLGDFDGDGRDDILLQSKAQSGQNATVITESSGKPKTGAHQAWGNDYLGYNWSLPYRNLIVGDYNGDGRDDLLLQEKLVVITVPLGAGGAPMPLVFRDGVGHAIVAAANDYYVAGNAGKFLGALPTWQDGDYGVDWSSSANTLLAADFDGNGVSELLIQGNSSSSTHKILEPQVGALNIISGFATTQSWQDGSLGATWSSGSSNLMIADVNGDGRSDVLIQARGTSTTSRTSLSNSGGTLGTATAANWSEPPLVATNYAVGTVGGEFSVGPGGSASYSIPIVVAPGVGGMQPDLSLVYNSQSGNGIAGVGWSIGGLSSIHRCAKNWEQDNTHDGIDMDAQDKLCLDGSRLIAVSGAYGASGTEYRTEIDSYSKIVQHDAGCGLACNFTVYTKAGQRFQYGFNGSSSGNGSRQELDGQTSGPLSWAVNRISDTVGNALNFSYTLIEADGAQRIRSITYTENSGITAQGEVEFVYDDRNDTSTGYLLGSKLKSDQRLQKVIARFAGDAIRSYEIGYKYSPISDLSLVDTIQECAVPESANRQCFVPTRFTWTENPARFSDWSAWAPNSGAFDLSRCRGIVQGDANGDGLTDIICAYDTDNQGSSARYTYVQLSNGDSYGNWQLWYSDGKSSSGLDLGVCSSIQPGDFNADGLTDLVCVVSGSAAVFVQLANTNNSYGAWQSWGGLGSCTAAEVGDLNGDGRSDMLCPYAGSDGKVDMKVLVSTGATFNAVQTWADSSTVIHSQCREFYAGDANGDGLTDMICAYDTTATFSNGQARTYVWASNGSTFNEARWDSGSNAEELQYCKKPTSADVNGDGLTDLICPYINGNSSDMKVQLSTGKSYLPWASWYSFSTSNLNVNNCSRLMPADVNDDGNQDLVCPYNYGNGTTRTFVMHSVNGTGFGGWTTVGNSNSYNLNNCSALLGGDADGNGQFDMMCVHNTGNGNEQTFVSAMTGTSPDLLSLIEPGNGAETHITHNPLTDNSVYTKDVNSNCPGYPTVCLQAPMYVVSDVSSSNGIGGQSASSYHYKYGRINVRGRGWLGFGEVSSTDNPTGITTRTVYNQEFSADTGVGNNSRKAKYAKSGVPDLAETRLANNTLIGKTVNTWNVIPQNSYTRFELQSNTTTETGYELSGALVTTVVTQNSGYDSYGNVGKVTVTTTGGGQTFTKVTDSLYTNDSTNWFLGRLSSSTVKSTLPDGRFLTRKSAFEYDPGTGLLTAEIVEPGDLQMELRTEYGYLNTDGQNYGLKTSVTVKDSGSATPAIATRTSTTSYDFSTLASGTYSVVSTNAKGHSETKVIDARFGVTKSLLGPNSLATSWLYDDFGRAQTENRADGTSTITTQAWCDGNCPPLAVWTVTSDTAGSALVTQYLDLLGRAIRSETTGLNGRLILADTDYDNRGQVESVSRNYFDGDTSYWTNTLYDDLGRVTKVTSPDGGEVSTAYNGLSTTITKHDLNGVYTDQTITQVKDAIGQEVQVIDEAGQMLNKTYDPFGNLEKTEIPNADVRAVTDTTLTVITDLAYDKRGRKTSMIDPDMGSWAYEYDALGQLRKQTDNMGQTTEMTYDVLGRMKTRNEAEGLTDWAYDTAAMGIGKLAGVTAPGGFEQVLTYDDKGRPKDDKRKINNTWYTSTTGYDLIYGRVDSQTYPTTGFAVKYDYNVDGYLTKVINVASPAEIFWQANDSDADGNVISFDLGNGLQTVKLYEPFSGRVMGITTGFGMSSTVQNVMYKFDSLGNFRERNDLNQNLTETFSYDARNRLIGSNLNGIGNKVYAYDSLGNIRQKGTVSNYQYGEGSAGPHAVTKAGLDTYTYDGNGNMLTGAGRSIAWTSYNKSKLITKGTTSVAFEYGPDRARFMQSKTVSGVTTNTVYFGKLYEEISKIGSTDIEKKHYISVGGSAIAIYNKFSSGVENVRYLHTDHLGSTDVITDAMGQDVESHSFDAFGSRRNVDWSDPSGLLTSLETTRGFTGHEQLDDVGLVHMNGRVYDPVLGRFISADPQVQFASNLQSYNRYSYVHNNPLSYTDPSGFGIWKKIKKAFRKGAKAIWKYSGNEWLVNQVKKSAFAQTVIKIAIVAACASNPATAVACAAGSSAGFTLLNGGSVGDAIFSGMVAGATALAFNGVGDMTAPGGELASAGIGGIAKKAVAHGLVGGVSSKFSGGGFQSGFLAAGATAGVNEAVPTNDIILGTVRSSVAGGVAAELGGGKFANGAATGSFSYLFNHVLHPKGDPHGEPFIEDGSLPRSSLRVLAGNRTLDPETGQVTLSMPDDWSAVPASRGGGVLIVPPEWRQGDGQLNIIRIQPPGTGSVQYNPDGYYEVFNESGQAISPYSGRTMDKARAHNHLGGVKSGQWRDDR